jgi:RimJ/RimL family protein N-acetyltransferase
MKAAPQVRLRAPASSDEPALLRWRTDAETQRLLMGRGTSRTIDDLREWIARRIRDPQGEFLVIAAGDREEPVGFVQLTRIDRAAGHGWLGLFVDEAARRSGVAGAALGLMEKRAARKHRLAKILIEVLAENEPALAFWRLHGYRSTETRAAHWSHAGRSYDVVMMEKRLARVPAASQESDA